MTLPEIISIITGSLTVAGVIVTVTRYITRLQLEVKMERLQADREKAETSRTDLMAVNKMLLDELASARRVGAAASAKKGEIDDELQSVMRMIQASGASIYIPLPTDDDKAEKGLAFLSIQPATQQTLKLRRKIVPIDSLAGRCFRTGKPFTVADSHKSSDHYDKADHVTGYQTRDTLNYPLSQQGKIVGILQLLNKEGGTRFSEDDISRVERLSPKLAAKVDEFLRIPDNLDVLGLVAQRDAECATVMFCDLTASSMLFQELNVSAAVQHINEYLQVICDVAFAHGATIDKYMGDGALFRFNVPRTVENHPREAIKAAFEIKRAFDEMKRDWLAMGELLDAVYVRIGLAYGPVQHATVGHPQYQYLTIFGTPINVAVNLCQVARRDQNVVVIDENLNQQLPGLLKTQPIPKSQIGKVEKYTSAAYEVLGMQEPN
ncbi:MAG: GAF domain-containing protein [Gemmataceae bacterium]